jgi:hypothetical protein
VKDLSLLQEAASAGAEVIWLAAVVMLATIARRCRPFRQVSDTRHAWRLFVAAEVVGLMASVASCSLAWIPAQSINWAFPLAVLLQLGLQTAVFEKISQFPAGRLIWQRIAGRGHE